jgi:hypothetical protein
VYTLTEALIQAIGAENTQARTVLISTERQRHILERRQIVSETDAELAAHRLAEALSHIHYMKVPQSKPNLFDLVGYVSSANRYIVVALKLVRAGSSKKGDNEWWIQTAYPCGAKTMRRLVKNGQYRPIRLA